MAESVIPDVEALVKEKVEEELQTLSFGRKKDMTKTAKDIIEILVPEMTKVISVAVSTAVKHAMEQMIDTVKSKTVDSFQLERRAVLQKYDCDRLEQYQRSENLRIYGLEEGTEESEDRLEEKVVELASNIGVNLDNRDISMVHRLG